jgi:ActR/RegA family two-component response regulator
LLVSDTPSLAQSLVSAIERSGFTALVVGDFARAQLHLTHPPALVVTELKLGAYNGLHLALHAAALHIQTIVIADGAFRHEVEQLGAVWISPEAATSDAMLQTMAEAALGALTPAEHPWYVSAAGADALYDSWHVPATWMLH